MNETVTFILQLRDMVSGGMAKIATTAQTVFGSVDRHMTQTQRKMGMVGHSVSDLNTHLELLTQKRDLSIGTAAISRANREIEQVERRLEKMQTMGRGDAAAASAGGGMHLPWWLSGAMIGGLAMAGIGGMVRVGADQQRDVTGLATFMGKAKAQAYYNDVQQDARVTPFVTHDLMSANRMLISTGMNADRARTDIMNLANAVAATGGSNYALERMAQHLQMIRGMGHASYMQLKEFTTNGINIMQLLSDATGKHIKMAHGMTVSYEAIEHALAHAAAAGGLFAGALYAQSQTIWGKWSTLMDDLQLSAGKIVTSQSSAITGLLDLFDKYAQGLPALAEQWAGAITTIITTAIGLVNALLGLAKWLYHNWVWIKYVVAVFYALKVAMWAATTVTGLYNAALAISAMRTAALAAAEGEATVATEGLTAALLLNPWVFVGAAIAGVIALLVKYNNTDVKDKFPGIKPGDRVIEGAGKRLATHDDYVNGMAHWEDGRTRGTRFGGYVMNDVDSWEADKTGFAKLHPKVHDEWELHEIYKKVKEAADIKARGQFVIYNPNNSISAAAARSNAMTGVNKEDTGEGVSEKGAITGGGRRQTIVNINHALLEIKEQVFNEVKGGVQDIERRMDEALLRVLQSLNAVN